MEDQTVPQKDIITGICVECALRRHDFAEILPRGKGDDQFFEAALPAAWIDGRRYRLLTPIGMQGATCHECNRKVANIYLPIVE
jgi:hypothetical protein